MEYVIEYAHLPKQFENGYVVSDLKDKVTLIIIEETLSAEERRKRLEKIGRRLGIKIRV